MVAPMSSAQPMTPVERAAAIEQACRETRGAAWTVMGGVPTVWVTRAYRIRRAFHRICAEREQPLSYGAGHASRIASSQP